MRPSLPNLPSRVEPSTLVYRALSLPIERYSSVRRTIPTEVERSSRVAVGLLCVRHLLSVSRVTDPPSHHSVASDQACKRAAET
jgi:hypothetical protein